jgi:hypothetical protein
MIMNMDAAKLVRMFKDFISKINLEINYQQNSIPPYDEIVEVNDPKLGLLKIS